MSFSSDVKTEICRDFPARRCCCLAMSFGVLLFANACSRDLIRITTESQAFAGMLPKIFKRAFGVTFDVAPEDAGSKQTFVITQPDKIGAILEACGFDRDTVNLHVNLGVLEEDCDRLNFLRGAFLAGGSVTDPAKAYHMELTTSHQAVARETYALIGEVMGFDPKLTARQGNAVLYIKQSESIADVLTMLGAPVCAMGLLEAKLEKELKNKVNRRCNCDDANTSKVVDAAQAQIAAIRVLEGRGHLSQLPAKLRQAAQARLDNPESNLTELAGLMEPPITKPAMSHRLKRLVELAGE